MARNVKHAGKVDGASAIVPTKPGPTVTLNDHAKFDGRGKTSGKTPANGVIDQGEGPTITCNDTLIPTMNADKAPKESKTIASGKSIGFPLSGNTEHLTASQTSGEGGPTDRPYALAKSYEKHGTKDSGKLPNLKA